MFLAGVLNRLRGVNPLLFSCLAHCSSAGTSRGYSSGIILAEYHRVAGRFILNILPICDHLSANPVADRLLGNLLRHASREASQSVAPAAPQLTG